ncbi:hypothetical protein [Rhizobium sp. A37_96]
MQTLRSAFLIGAGLIAAAGLASQALAQQQTRPPATRHQMTVRLPDGSLEVIRYSGDQPPAVEFRGASDPTSYTVTAFDPFDDASPFAEMQRISAEMDRETAAMFNNAQFLAQWPAGADNVMKIDLSRLPKGAQGYTMISTTSGKGTCTRITEYISSGSDKPQVRTSSSGNCDALQSPAAKRAHAIAPPPLSKHQSSGVIEASYRPNSKTIRTAGLF